MKKPKLYRQEKDYSCAVACLRMVLEHYGVKEDEKSLRIKTKTKFYGTHPINVVDCAASYGLKAYVSSLTVSRLRQLNSLNIPVITNILKAADNEFYIHSVVVYRAEKDIIFLLDPEDGDIKFEMALFESLWQGTGRTAVIIEKP